MVGRIVSKDEFSPEAAIILKDRDEVLIPLLLETIPSAAEFRAATQSLSPEQIRFSKAFRSMQLESSLLGMPLLFLLLPLS